MIKDEAIDPAPLHGRTVAIIGFGNQGRAQALNLRDSGVRVVVGLRPGSGSEAEVRSAGFDVMTPAAAVRDADLAMLLAPDERLAAIYDEVAPGLRHGAAVGFSHGLAIHFGLIAPRPDLDVIMVAPKGPGTALRSLYLEGQGMVALAAVAQDASGAAWPLALAYAQALGCGRAGVIRSTFEEECVADLFNEGAVVWGAVPAILQAGFETLVAGGIQPEVAYLECVSELKLLAGLIEARGIAGTAEAISNTAEFGALLGGPAIVDRAVRGRMEGVLADVRSGAFVQALSDEAEADYPRLRAARQKARAGALEAARLRLLKQNR
ncbi:ketol-acid reductoisomerase [Sphingomonas sp. BN140010]|uniref:Ketol-acid reductoisomerase n=1 Tax=Sphingomonas arvum TaxID=2992113 RepID=A0ABT3JEB8_9SPHN|nr:ketol-acid reductoisomerase [Sphingomonas sp. BN140010]MCW3797386.1 ketol-acid reductoisomerase [Sphingomonas sp. BN140010]